MKHLKTTICLICISLLLVRCDKFDPTDQSKDSFKNVIGSINWNNAKPDKKSLKTSCTATLMKMALSDLPKKPTLKKDSHSLLFLLLDRIDSTYDKLIKTYDLEDKLSEDTGIFTVTAKDKLLNSRINARNEKDFIKKVKTRRDGKLVDWGKKEKKLDEALASIYNDKTGITFEMKNSDNNHCSLLFLHIFEIKKLTSQKITLDVECKIFYTCDCLEEHSNEDIEKGHITFSRTVEATFPNNPLDFNTIIFKDKGNPKYIITKADCCKKEKD